MSIFTGKEALVHSMAPEQYKRVCLKIQEARNTEKQPQLRYLFYKQQIKGLLAKSFIGGLMILYFGGFLLWSVRQIKTKYHSLNKYRNLLLLAPIFDSKAAHLNSLRGWSRILTYSLFAISGFGCGAGLYCIGSAAKGLVMDEIPFENQIEKELFSDNS